MIKKINLLFKINNFLAVALNTNFQKYQTATPIPQNDPTLTPTLILHSTLCCLWLCLSATAPPRARLVQAHPSLNDTWWNHNPTRHTPAYAQHLYIPLSDPSRISHLTISTFISLFLFSLTPSKKNNNNLRNLVQRRRRRLEEMISSNILQKIP